MKKRHSIPLALAAAGAIYETGRARGMREERSRRKRGINPKDIRPGDILKVDRGPYVHYGIAASKKSVIEFGHENRFKRNTLRVAKIPYEKFSKDDPVQLEHPMGPFEPREIVKRAAAHIKTGYGDYSLLGNNCEHFAREMAEGKRHSTQVEKNPIGKFYLKRKTKKDDNKKK
jgi:hypothetical protein